MTKTLCTFVAKIDIPPPVGTNIQGYLGDGRAIGVFENLYAKALARDLNRWALPPPMLLLKR